MVRKLQVVSLCVSKLPVPVPPSSFSLHPCPSPSFFLTHTISHSPWRMDLGHGCSAWQPGWARILYPALQKGHMPFSKPLSSPLSSSPRPRFPGRIQLGVKRWLQAAPTSNLNAHGAAESLGSTTWELLTLPTEGKVCSFVEFVLKGEHK